MIDLPDEIIKAIESEGPTEYEEAKTGIFMVCADLDRGTCELLYHAKKISAWNDVQGFWQSGNVGEKFMLIVTEVAEAMEGHREGGQSLKIPEFTKVEEELADAVIRLLDFVGHFNLRLDDAIAAKLRYNLTRPYKHGKTC
jgi:NTP pyrophosphatase (non-canonical NTP hydrolase)